MSATQCKKKRGEYKQYEGEWLVDTLDLVAYVKT